MEQREKKSIIDNKTLIPLGLIGVIIAGVWFVSTLSAKVYADADRLDKVEDAIIKITDVQIQISSLETKIDSLQKQINMIIK